MRTLVTLEALSLQVDSLSEEHVNRAPFTGILTRLNEPSTRPPSGSDGHLVLMRHDAAQRALSSLLGMGVNCTADLKGHARQSKIGVITAATIQDSDLVISGFLYEKDFPEEVAAIRASKDELGMSYELSSVEVEDPDAPVWVLVSFIFTGAAILYKNAAAYEQTAIAAQAGAEEENAMDKAIMEKLADIAAQLDTMKAEADERAAATNAEATEAAEDTEATSTEATTEAAEDTEAAAMEAAMSAMKRLMKAMGKCKESEAAEDQEAMMEHILQAMLRSMAYPGGGFGSEHDDEAEDTALFRRLMRQGRMDGKKDSPVTPGLAAMQRQLKEVSAAMGLITDTLKRHTGLITDMAKSMRNLATDENHGNNGGPVRKSMSAEQQHGQFVGKFDGAEVEGSSGEFATKLAELEAQMDKEQIKDPQIRIARKLEFQATYPKTVSR